ncbi:MAG: RHS repeat-associated core domain-containing protein, partial [Candidatus Angelobacter sp.]
SPANGATVSSSSLSVTGSVSDTLSGVAAVSCNGVAAIVQSGSFNCSITLSPGANTLTVHASDVAGNTSSATENVTFSNAAAPVINSFTPTSGPIGTQITVTGSNFTANGTGTPTVALSQQGGGSIGAPVATFTATSISFVIPAGATSGPVTVTAANSSTVSADSLSVVASSGFSVTAGPSSASVQQGTSTSYSVTLNSSNGFSQLAKLSVTGLPSGVTAGFSPAQITTGQIAILTISAPAGQSTSNATLTISAAATVEGIPTTASASVGLAVQAASTSLIGRTVESDNIETPIPGITITFLGVDDAGHTTGCSGQTRSDAAGNFAFTNLSSSCLGRQLVGYNGDTATDNEKYAGVNLGYTMTAGQVTGPELVHLPVISNAETIMVQQNASVDQVFSYSTIPGVVVTVYAGTTLTLPDGTQPSPFPMAAVLVPVDRLPDAPPPTTGTLRASIVAFQPADTTSNQPVSVTFPNIVNSPPGVNMELDTLDPIVGELVKYGTGTVSSDASEIVPDSDPAHPGHRFGISHFDWHGPMAPAPNGNNPSPDPHSPKNGDPVDTASGLLDFTKTDISFGGARGQVSIQRTYRTLSGTPGPFGVGTNHNYGYDLDVSNLIRGTGAFVTLVMPDGNQFQFVEQGTNTFVNSTIPSLLGAVISSPSTGTYNLRWKNGATWLFQTTSQGALLAFLSSITDIHGNTITLVRNQSQPTQITQVIDPTGRTLNIAYDNFNRIASLTDPIGRTVQYTYNPQGTLATVTDPAGGVTTYGYDTQNRMSSITDARNITYLQNLYDANGRVSQQTFADSGVTTFSYTLLNPTVPNSPVLLTTVTDPKGNTTTYHFNPQGFLLDVTDALGEKTIYTLDPGNNQVLTVTDHLGRTTAFDYDSLGNVIAITRLSGTPNAVTTSFTYDPTFNTVTNLTDPLGRTTTLKYDRSGNLLSVADALGKPMTFAYDSNGELISSTDALGKVTKFSFLNGDLVRITDPLGRVTTRFIDAIGRMLSLTNPLGQTITYQYNPLNELALVTDPQHNQTSFTYDGNGNLLTTADAKHNQTSYTYDKMDRLATRTPALNHPESYQYDLAGNLTQFTDRRNVLTKYSYDTLNRRTQESFGSEESISYSYDAGGRLIEATDSITGAISRTYDSFNRVLSETTPQGNIVYSYDAAGRRTGMTISGQQPVTYSFDDGNRVLQIAQGSSQVQFDYDDDDRRTSMTLPNGVVVNYSYDATSQLTGIDFGLLGNLTYSYDPAGRRISVGGSLARTGMPAALASANYNAGNQLTLFGASNLTYDANGNLTSDGNNTYTWSARNQLVSISGRTTASFQYDAFGRRVSRTVNGTTQFVYDGVNPVEELSGTTVTASMLAGFQVDEYFQRTDSSGTASFLSAALGSTLALSGINGATLASYTYEPFGNTVITGTASNPFQFTGRENDATGLYFLRARFYSPILSRFISEDPLGFTGSGPNFYAYAGNDPIGSFDPLGLDKKPPCTPPQPTGWQRVAAGAGGVGNLLLGVVGVIGGVGAAEATGGFSLYLAYNSLGTIVSGGSQLVGAITGNLAGAQQVANYASAASSISGLTTLAITGDAEKGATASDIENLVLTAGLAGASAGGDLPEKLNPDAAAYAGAGQSAANLILPGNEGGCK